MEGEIPRRGAPGGENVAPVRWVGVCLLGGGGIVTFRPLGFFGHFFLLCAMGYEVGLTVLSGLVGGGRAGDDVKRHGPIGATRGSLKRTLSGSVERDRHFAGQSDIPSTLARAHHLNGAASPFAKSTRVSRPAPTRSAGMRLHTRSTASRPMTPPPAQSATPPEPNTRATHTDAAVAMVPTSGADPDGVRPARHLHAAVRPHPAGQGPIPIPRLGLRADARVAACVSSVTPTSGGSRDRSCGCGVSSVGREHDSCPRVRFAHIRACLWRGTAGRGGVVRLGPGATWSPLLGPKEGPAFSHVIASGTKIEAQVR